MLALFAGFRAVLILRDDHNRSLTLAPRSSWNKYENSTTMLTYNIADYFEFDISTFCFYI